MRAFRHHGRSVAVAGVLVALVAPAAASAQVPPSQQGVRVDLPATARVSPSNTARALMRVEPTTPMTLSTMVLPVVGRPVGTAAAGWVRVELPLRPNGTTGWLPLRVTHPVTLPWRIVVSTGRRLATVYRSGKVVRRFRVVVGAPATPTPRGHFFVVERVRLHNSWAHGVWALALSAHSNVLQQFDGGDGQVALHGRGLLAAPLGTAASHGCVRFADSDITWLAGKIPDGTPVDVQG